MTFYQLKELITVKGVNDKSNGFVIDRIFNIELIAMGREELKNLCSFKGMTIIHQMLFTGYISPMLMASTVAFCLALCKALNLVRCAKKRNALVSGKFYVGYYIVLAFCYKIYVITLSLLSTAKQ